MQRQDSTYDQLKTVYDLANKAGCYDAADVIKNTFLNPIAEKLEENHIPESKVSIRAPFQHFASKYGWDEVCEVLGWDIYWAKEGHGSSEDLVSLSQEQIDKLNGK